MNPLVGRVALTMAILFLFLSLLPLPYLIGKKEYYASFVVDIFAIFFSLLFLILVVWDIRRQVKRELQQQ
ncbi:MAG: hypothetical protein DRJ52_04840 [Thermoprotei archaeon]|nr:MAG: hypothetical protein DRJ52_04840 [Thermoprotei archaeon]RLE99323.1 MAG: hypothetical protein DRJ63_05700 [Thermoprotei archaeon]